MQIANILFIVAVSAIVLTALPSPRFETTETCVDGYCTAIITVTGQAAVSTLDIPNANQTVPVPMPPVSAGNTCTLLNYPAGANIPYKWLQDGGSPIQGAVYTLSKSCFIPNQQGQFPAVAYGYYANAFAIPPRFILQIPYGGQDNGAVAWVAQIQPYVSSTTIAMLPVNGPYQQSEAVTVTIFQ